MLSSNDLAWRNVCQQQLSMKYNFHFCIYVFYSYIKRYNCTYNKITSQTYTIVRKTFFKLSVNIPIDWSESCYLAILNFRERWSKKRRKDELWCACLDEHNMETNEHRIKFSIREICTISHFRHYKTMIRKLE